MVEFVMRFILSVYNIGFTEIENRVYWNNGLSNTEKQIL